MVQLPNNYLAVQMPEGVEGCEIRGRTRHPNDLLSFYGEADALEIPPGSYTIVSKGDEVTEAQAGEIVEVYNFGGVDRPYNYTDSMVLLDTAIESFHSLLLSLSLNPSEIVILKKIK